MKQSEINKLTITELQEKLGEFKKSYADLKMAHAISSLEKPIQLRNVKGLLQATKWINLS